MSALLWTHIAGGAVAVLTGYVALAARKGTPLHVRFGRAFAVAMLVLGVSASLLEPLRQPQPGSIFGGIIVVYLIATAWSAARRRGEHGARFERAAVAIPYLAIAAILGLWLADSLGMKGVVIETPPAGGHASGIGLWLFAAWRDARYRRAGVPSFEQRRLRHAWRICLAMFVATGSFFLGQQDVLPAMLRGPWQWVLAFAPLAYLAVWRLWPRNARVAATRAVIAPEA